VLLTVVTTLIWGVFFVLRTLVGVGSTVASGASSSGASAAGAGLTILGILLGLVMWVLLVAVVGGYYALLVTSRGQTLGMQLLDVTVVSGTGGPVTQNQSIKRTAVLLAPMPLMALSSLFIPLVGFPLALAMMGGWLLVEAAVLFVDDDAQRLGDRVADTYVVEAGA
jgi:uncharacterized RDD family membrane protein YckC